MKTLHKLADQQALSSRLARLSPFDKARWGSMSSHQMVCHLNDSYKVALGEKTASPATGFVQRTIMKWYALKVPLAWPKGVPTRPEMEQGKGGSPPVEFHQDLDSLLATVDRFCKGLPSPPVDHPIFGKMTVADWMRWGYLHTHHHLRQFDR